MSLGENVRWRRMALGLTQAELAARVRLNHRPVHPTYITLIEEGRRDPRLSLVCSLARALKCYPWQLTAEIYEGSHWWDDYMALSAKEKREVQHMVRTLKERR